jgi:hypothetical protein
VAKGSAAAEGVGWESIIHLGVPPLRGVGSSPGSRIREPVWTDLRHYVPESAQTNRFSPFSSYPWSPLTQLQIHFSFVYL